MFNNATHRLIRQIDQDGVLIAVSRRNDSEMLKPLAVVRKHPAKWFWQRTKYRPTAFTLNDLLQGDPIEPVLEQTEFLKYKENHKSIVAGSMEAGIVGINLAAKGQGASKLSSSLGALRKERVSMQSLLKDSSHRKVDFEHRLIQQTWGKSNHAFTLVVERIFTSCDCTIEYRGLDEGSCSAIWQILGLYPAEIRLKESSSLHYDTNVAIEIPPDTVLAYSVTNLDIKSDGSYELSACFDGFESDDDTTKLPYLSEDEVDGFMALPGIHEGSSLSALKEGLKACFCALADLPAQSRASLLLLFRKIILKRSLLSTLEDKLDMIRFTLEVGETSCLSQDDESNELIDSFLELIQSPKTITNGLSTTHQNQNGSKLAHQNGLQTPPANSNGISGPAYLNGSSSKVTNQNGSHVENGASIMSAKQSRSVLTSVHMLVSAAEGLTEDGLVLLESLCTPELLSGLNILVNLLTDDSQSFSMDNLPAPLQNEDIYLKVEKLFNASNILLKREKEKFWMKRENRSDHLPLVLCVVIHGLAHLSEAL